MLRLLFLPTVLLIATILFGVVLWFVIKKLKKGIDSTIEKGVEIASDQQQKWAEKGQRKKLPAILQKGFNDYDLIVSHVDNLPDAWQQRLNPLLEQAKEILDEVAFEFSSESNNQKNQDKKLNSIRSFFHHSLDALLQLVEKLNADYDKLDANEIQKAKENITVLKADLQSHQETLHKVRRFDFDVVMDVIKARLKR